MKCSVHRPRGHMAWSPWQPGVSLFRFGNTCCLISSRKVKLALPCIGADALGMGLREMDWSAVEIAYAWDVDPCLLPFLFAAHGPFGLGGSESGIGWGGDVLTFDVASMERVGFLVTGPPCPPWRQIGLRRAE